MTEQDNQRSPFAKSEAERLSELEAERDRLQAERDKYATMSSEQHAIWMRLEEEKRQAEQECDDTRASLAECNQRFSDGIEDRSDGMPLNTAGDPFWVTGWKFRDVELSRDEARALLEGARIQIEQIDATLKRERVEHGREVERLRGAIAEIRRHLSGVEGLDYAGRILRADDVIRQTIGLT